MSLLNVFNVFRAEFPKQTQPARTNELKKMTADYNAIRMVSTTREVLVVYAPELCQDSPRHQLFLSSLRVKLPPLSFLRHGPLEEVPAFQSFRKER